MPQIEELTTELGTVWEEMLEAVEVILSAAEQIETTVSDIDGDSGSKVSEALDEIVQACGFQGVSGQRIASMVGILSYERMAGWDVQNEPRLPERAL